MEHDLKHLEFLAENSKENIEKQVDSFRQQHTYAGTIIGFTVLFIPFFLNSLNGNNTIIQFISIVPIVFFISAILLMLSIFRGKPLDQALSSEKYQKMVNQSYKDILLFEIEANKMAYIKNSIITINGYKRYSHGIALTTIAVLIAIILLLSNSFIAIKKTPTKVQVVNPIQKK
ncbi:MAG: hypothetical protein ABI554_09030 [Flavobacterium sp.]